MAIIIETCPKCGHDLTDLVLATYPPIPQKKCFDCGWSWTGEREEVVRVPFGGNSLEYDKLSVLDNYTSLNLIVDDITDITNITKEEVEEYMKSTTTTMITNYVEKYFED